MLQIAKSDDTAMRRFGQFVRDTWRLAKPYFTSEEKWIAIGLVVAVLGLSVLGVRINVILNRWNGALFNSLQAKDSVTFFKLFLTWDHDEDGFLPGFIILATAAIVIYTLRIYATQWLQIRWRNWLTRHYVDRWLSGKAYYRIALATEHTGEQTDNPDQRIAEDVRDFVDNTLNLGRSLIANAVNLVSFVVILWALSGPITLWGITIPGYMVWVAIAYAGIFTVLTHWIGHPLIPLNFLQQRVEADFRYAAVRVRENAEGIALYDGEAEENANLRGRFDRVVANWYSFIRHYAYLNIFTYAVDVVSGVFPFLVVAPRYFGGALPLGGVTRVVGAFGQVQGALSWFINAYSGSTPQDASLARWRSIVARLSTFDRAINDSQHVSGPTVAPVSGRDAVQLEKVTLQLPDATPLVQDADLSLRAGETVLISGRSGSGKSTLFRALAGIWPYGRGRVSMPGGSAMFLPQRAYIPLGTLRHVVTYPAAAEAFTDAEIAHALSAVGLGQLVHDLDIEEHWPTRLSGGEQQRVAVARALLSKPDWLFLDEATANLDPQSEEELYDMLRRELPGTTLVSIAHRTSIAQFHTRRLDFRREPGRPGQIVDVTPVPAE
ncbi:MAG TPA: ABC transporter ATP-binding protein/permease [Acidisphaera sp.]|nr:ABC transporter ATP-binding protein/permease [Acidisphaera sp.]